MAEKKYDKEDKALLVAFALGSLVGFGGAGPFYFINENRRVPQLEKEVNQLNNQLRKEREGKQLGYQLASPIQLPSSPSLTQLEERVYELEKGRKEDQLRYHSLDARMKAYESRIDYERREYENESKARELQCTPRNKMKVKTLRRKKQ